MDTGAALVGITEADTTEDRIQTRGGVCAYRLTDYRACVNRDLRK
jgi:hypothetical protein